MPRLVLDTNMLLVFIVGSVDPNLLGITKRVKEYRPADYEIIVTYLGFFNDVILLPTIVSETSNLLDQMWGERRKLCMTLLADLTQTSNEIYVRSGLAATQPEYMELGITDASILCVLNEDTYLLTADLALYLAAICRRQNAQRFEDLRA